MSGSPFYMALLQVTEDGGVRSKVERQENRLCAPFTQRHPRCVLQAETLRRR